MCALLLVAGIPALADLSGQWSAGGVEVFILRQNGNTVTGTITGKPFHNLAQGTFTDDEIIVSGSRENTTIREYRLVLKRIRK